MVYGGRLEQKNKGASVMGLTGALVTIGGRRRGKARKEGDVQRHALRVQCNRTEFPIFKPKSHSILYAWSTSMQFSVHTILVKNPSLLKLTKGGIIAQPT